MKLILHTGGYAATLDEVSSANTPMPTQSHTPIPHRNLIDTVSSAIESAGLRIGETQHALAKEGDRYFGLMEILRDGQTEGQSYRFVLGLRNSHDKAYPAGMVVGARVFVCDNLSFSGEVSIARKHTRYIMRDLPGLTAGAVCKLNDAWQLQGRRFDAYSHTELSDKDVHDIIIRAVDLRACPNQMIPSILQEWREPKHEEFKPRNGWSLFNAFTESYKGTSVFELPKRTTALHGLMDTISGLN